MKKPLCPILLIGFPAPEEGKRDIRRCTNECAWFNADGDCCSIKHTADMIEDFLVVMSEGYLPSFYPDEEESYEFDPNTKTN